MYSAFCFPPWRVYFAAFSLAMRAVFAVRSDASLIAHDLRTS